MRRPVVSLFLSFVLSLTIAAAVPAATLTGRVTDPDGRPVAGARVLISGPLAVPRTVETDADGRYRATDLVAGRYEVRAIREGFAADPQHVTLADRDTRALPMTLHVSAVAESLVVTASPVATAQSRVADDVTVLTARDLEAHHVSRLADALRLVPGLDVTQSGTPGAITSVFPQGGESNYTLVLVDGMRANAFGGGFDFAHLPVADIERIEVVRGAQSAVFGSDAMGGVIQIITKQGGAPQASASVEGGSLGTTRYDASANGSSGGWSWGGGGERIASQGFTGLAADGTRVSNDDGEERAASGSLGWSRPGGLQWRATARLTWNDRGFPGPYGSDPLGSYSGVDRISRGTNNDRQVGLRLDQPFANQRVHQQVSVNYTDLTEQFTSPFGASNTGSRRIDLRSLTDAALGARVGLSAGLELDEERAVNTYITEGAGQQMPIPRLVAGFFGEGRYRAGDRVFLTAGVRAENIRQGALAASTDPFAPRLAVPESLVWSVNPKGSIAWFARGDQAGDTWTKLHATAGTGIRPPDAFELAFTDNPHLRPERSRSVEAGLEQGLWRGRLVVDATAFLNRYRDLIVEVGQSLRDFSQFQTDNIANARARGVELSATIRTAYGLHLRASYTFLDTSVLPVDGSTEAQPPFHVGEWLLRRPRHAAMLDATWTGGRTTLSGTVGARGRTLDVDPTLGALGGVFTNPGYTTVAASGSYRVASHLSVYARADNLLNRNYEEVFGFPAAGRTILAGVRVGTAH
ncbi:MAG TPA: TonB-dependent receptor [Vicinamibacterales bacterium]|jgi:outer membrane cobalamin receptor